MRGSPALPTSPLQRCKRWASILCQDKVVLASFLAIVLVLIGALYAPVFLPGIAIQQDLRLRNQPPSFVPGNLHIFGTDYLGRDTLGMIMEGARLTLVVGLGVSFGAMALGSTLGLIAGFFRGRVEDVIMRWVDVQMGFPTYMLALAIIFALGPGFDKLMIILIITRWTLFTRITRGLVMSMREDAFVEAARCIGCGNARIIFKHIAPNLLSPLIVLGTLEMARAILNEASLSFLGLGIQPPQTSWGLALAEGRAYLRTAWWTVAFPGLAIFVTCLSVNLLATWLRTITDPVQRAKWLKVPVVKARV